jgi:hypothetical protein
MRSSRAATFLLLINGTRPDSKGSMTSRFQSAMAWLLALTIRAKSCPTRSKTLGSSWNPESSRLR